MLVVICWGFFCYAYCGTGVDILTVLALKYSLVAIKYIKIIVSNIFI